MKEATKQAIREFMKSTEKLIIAVCDDEEFQEKESLEKCQMIHDFDQLCASMRDELEKA